MTMRVVALALLLLLSSGVALVGGGPLQAADIALEWDAVERATSYVLEYRVPGAIWNEREIDATCADGTCSYQADDLPDADRLYFRMWTQNEAGRSAEPSNEVFKDYAVPPSPALLQRATVLVSFDFDPDFPMDVRVSVVGLRVGE